MKQERWPQVFGKFSVNCIYWACITGKGRDAHTAFLNPCAKNAAGIGVLTGVRDADGTRVPGQMGMPYLLGVPRLWGGAAPAWPLGTGSEPERERGAIASSHLCSCPQEHPQAAGVRVGPYLEGRRFRDGQEAEASGASGGPRVCAVGTTLLAVVWSVTPVGC